MVKSLLHTNRFRPLWLAGLLLVPVVAGCRADKSKPLEVPPDRYRPMVSAFYTGLIALQEGDNLRALNKTREATQIIPEEPAPWANLGLLQLRNRELDKAAESLAKARSLAPPNGRVELLYGLLASQQGRSDEALQSLRKAVELDPTHLPTRYALIEELRRQPVEQAAAETEQQWEKILQQQPDNLVALLELTQLAARQGDATKLKQRFERLKAEADIWPPDPRRQLQELEKALGSADARSLATRVAVLGNLLRPTPVYQQSYAALKRLDNAVGVPLERFLRLHSPSASPSASDTALTFTPQPISGNSAWTLALPLAAEKPPALAYPSGASLVLDTSPPGRLLLPGGAGVPLAAGVLALDWNNDFHPDLAIAGSGGLRLFLQRPPGKWADVTARTGLPAAVTSGSYTGAWPADIDMDGDLDIVLGAASGPPTVLRNNGDGTWATIRPFQRVSGLRAFAWADLDGDIDPDAAVVDGAGKLVVFSNERSGHFRRFPDPLSQGTVQALSAADADHDGTLDLVALLSDGAIQRLSLNAAADGWETAELVQWAEAPPDGSGRLLWADLDNNGAPDLLASGSRGTQIWLTDAPEKLTPLPSPPEARIFSAADLNADGKMDLVGVTATGAPVRLLNQSAKGYHWQVIRPRAARQGDQRNNTFGVGGEMELRAALLYQKVPVTGPAVHFGLGEHPAADAVRILWPSGASQGEFELPADKAITKDQRLTGSCPWLFAHDGRSVQFVTDILWKSPLGLRINAQDTAGVVTTRDWVKLRGDQLAPRDGFYDLRITAELWETNFFDYVALMTVDHPTGSEVFIDERFVIPPPPLAVETTGPVTPVARAIDDRGQDVTEIVRARDGRYLDTFGRGPYQGITRDHWVEVELPEADVQAFRRSGVGEPAPERPNARTPERLFLVAHGWIHPTDSSINVAISQGRHAPPQSLSVEVPDGRGGWRTVRSGIGFPAGKNKTVLIDLAGLFSLEGRGPRRLRLRTNLEIYWDSLGVAVANPDARARRQLILPQVADLHYRGFSEVRQADASSPELPVYDRIMATTPIWADLIGFYTRFGDVRELLKSVDDRYVIMNAGDEILLRFPAPPPPPAGWTRDFVFISDGWDKDGNLNTTFSKTVLPLPSHDEPEYNRPPGPLQHDPVYRRYPRDWEVYHTRYVTPRAFREALLPSR